MAAATAGAAALGAWPPPPRAAPPRRCPLAAAAAPRCGLLVGFPAAASKTVDARREGPRAGRSLPVGASPVLSLVTPRQSGRLWEEAGVTPTIGSAVVETGWVCARAALRGGSGASLATRAVLLTGGLLGRTRREEHGVTRTRRKGRQR